jgi:serine/threonine protein kinase
MSFYLNENQDGGDMAVLEELIGQVLDEKYRIEKPLGQGGMSAVYLATHLGTERPVALKLIAPQFMAHPEFVERFKLEARAAGRLRHPNVVNVTDFGFAPVGPEQVAYLVMEYLDGCSLGEVLHEENRLPLGWVVDILEQVCSAIDEAHQQGIIHRDLKPDNIWLEPNRRGGFTVKVLDFGLAKLGEVLPARSPNEPAIVLSSENCLIHRIFSRDPGGCGEAPTLSETYTYGTGSEEFSEADTRAQTPIDNDEDDTRILDHGTGGGRSNPNTAGITQAGSLLGTPLYMSPEQCRSEMLDARSDIYSLGVIAYQMLSGQTPFRGNTHALIEQHTKALPPKLGTLRSDIPRSVSALVMLALAKNPAERPASVAAFASALRANSEGPGTLLRQAITLFSEHLPTFFRISLIGNIPLIIVSIISIVSSVIAYSTSKLVDQPSIPLKFIYVGTIVLWLLAILSAKVLNAGLFVPVVAQLLVAPLRPVRIRPILALLKKRLRPFITSLLLFHLMLAPLTLSFTIPMMAKNWMDTPLKLFSVILSVSLLALVGMMGYFYYSLYPSVVIMEGRSGLEALRRSKTLSSRSLRTVIVIISSYAVIYFLILPSLLGLLCGFFVGKFSGSLGPELSLIISGNMSRIITTMTGFLITPLVAIELSMLYFKTRQAGGETLKEALGQEFEEANLPKSKWQLRMRERLRLNSRSSSRSNH